MLVVVDQRLRLTLQWAEGKSRDHAPEDAKLHLVSSGCDVIRKPPTLRSGLARWSRRLSAEPPVDLLLSSFAALLDFVSRTRIVLLDSQRDRNGVHGVRKRFVCRSERLLERKIDSSKRLLMLDCQALNSVDVPSNRPPVALLPARRARCSGMCCTPGLQPGRPRLLTERHFAAPRPGSRH